MRIVIQINFGNFRILIKLNKRCSVLIQINFYTQVVMPWGICIIVLIKIAKVHTHTHLINLTVIVQLQIIPLFLEVVKKAPVGHIWHHYGNPVASIETHPNQRHDARMVKVLHLVHLTHHALNIRQREQTCMHIEYNNDC